MNRYCCCFHGPNRPKYPKKSWRFRSLFLLLCCLLLRFDITCVCFNLSGTVTNLLAFSQRNLFPLSVTKARWNENSWCKWWRRSSFRVASETCCLQRTYITQSLIAAGGLNVYAEYLSALCEEVNITDSGKYDFTDLFFIFDVAGR